MNKAAKLTIVMPVYNAAKSIDQAILNVRNQTFRDLEIIVLDNCSTDNTYEIAVKHAAQDSRIVVYRRDKNIGITANFIDGLSHGTSKLFAYRAHDDFSTLDYFERLVHLMDANPEAVLAVGSVERVWGDGRKVTIKADFRGRREMTLNAPASWFYGVWRRDFLAKRFTATNETYSYVGGIDYVILYHPLISGLTVSDPQALFTQRAPNSTRSYVTPDKMAPREQWRFRRIFKQHCIRDNALLPLRDRVRYALMPTFFTEKHGTKVLKVLRAALRSHKVNREKS